MKFNNHLINIYIFIESFNNLIEKKILKIKNIRIIYENTNIPSENFFKVLKFCKINKIKLYILDNFRIVLKYKLNGLLISSYNKEISKIQSIQLKKKNIEILGKVHNQLEFYQKIRQGCRTIFLSPIFFTKKYSANKTFGVSKFNLISLNWNSNLVALGGINFSNYKKVRMTKSIGIGVKTFIENIN
jgi:thiamine monophosphate synthase